MKFLEILTLPSEVFAEAKPRSSLIDALVVYAGVGVVSGFLLGLVFLLFLRVMAPSVGYAALVIPPLLFTFITVVGSLFLNGVYFLLAKLFGGKGSLRYNTIFLHC